MGHLPVAQMTHQPGASTGNMFKQSCMTTRGNALTLWATVKAKLQYSKIAVRTTTDTMKVVTAIRDDY
jgi:RecA/RadA recombinase